MSRLNQRSLTVLAAGLLVMSLIAVDVSTAQKSDREENGLSGPVQSVTEYYAECWEQSGQWVEEPRKKVGTVEYDRSGKMVELVSYEDDGSVRSKRTWKYDAKGRLIEESYQEPYACTTSYKYGNDGKIVEALEQDKILGTKRGVYKYGNKGNLVEVAWYRSDGTLSSKEVFKYDEKGNQTERTSYDGDGSLRSKNRYKYDAQGKAIETEWAFYDSDGSVNMGWKHLRKYDAKGNVIELIAYGTDGLLNYKETYKYDARGNIIELLHYDRDGSLTQSYTFQYIFDSHGNWIKQTRLMRVIKAGKSFWAPNEVRYRTITYY